VISELLGRCAGVTHKDKYGEMTHLLTQGLSKLEM